MKGNRTARFWIWTVEWHDEIAAAVRTYFFAAFFAMLLLCFGGVISPKEMAVAMFVGGFMLLGLLWIAIERRRSALKAIDDPELRRRAERAMLQLIAVRKLSRKDKRRIQGNV